MKTIFTLIALIGLALPGFAQCDTGAHSTSLSDAWLSCQTGINPNPARGEGHWILYDLGDVRAFYGSHFWNLNVPGSTGQGVQNCVFDVSFDGNTWFQAAEFQFPQAPGNANYTGVDGPDFEGVSGRYLLLTVLSNWNGSNCSGFGEIRVEIGEGTVNIVEQELSFGVYPNPVSDQLTVRNYSQGQVTLEVFNMAGRLVHTTQMTGSTHRLDVSPFTPGLYVVRLYDSNGKSASQRVIVQR
jgi:hypothetical protein